MDWNAATVWWIATGGLIVVELLTGSFYLLMLAIGAAAGALAAHLGLGTTAQMLVAAVVGGVSVVNWHVRRSQRPGPAPASSNPDVNLDVGQSVQVETWSPDGCARVHYRGAQWQARFVGTQPPQAGRHFIRAVEGTCLLLDR